MSFYVKMAQIMAEINRLPKTATNAHFKYKYTPDVAVYDECRRLIAEKGLAFFASMTGVEQTFAMKTNASGQPVGEWHSLVHFEFVLVDSESGETKTCAWSAEANDAQDKGISKCATVALKYWLLKTFIISTGDDPEAVGSAPAKAKSGADSKPKTTAAPDFAGNAHAAGRRKPAVSAPATTPPTSTNSDHWKDKPDLRANFDRAMSNAKIDDKKWLARRWARKMKSVTLDELLTATAPSAKRLPPC